MAGRRRGKSEKATARSHTAVSSTRPTSFQWTRRASYPPANSKERWRRDMERANGGERTEITPEEGNGKRASRRQGQKMRPELE
ncbi:hypothetical protein BDY21DRAFT_331894 [Lineolata rhizophorae]|uniref:Uncharacterized protein n=1 Tax=Lineolata rhizophorae TaxID=578093 RepID=A0A6A6PBY1_9PEZI|nr:hypothetical protein BDY21DRAFT_331894 [Lineolata rhizophorae]